MLGVIKRVISGEDMDEGQPSQRQQSHPTPVTSSYPPNACSAMPSFAIVENDDDQEVDNSCNPSASQAMDVDGIDNVNEDVSLDGSSLSNVSEAANEGFETSNYNDMNSSNNMVVIMDETTTNHNLSLPTGLPPSAGSTNRNTNNSTGAPFHVNPSHPNSNILARSDSRNSTDSYSSYGRQSSQNSSRDWGWFEDVHVATDHGANIPVFKRSKHNPVAGAADFAPTIHRHAVGEQGLMEVGFPNENKGNTSGKVRGKVTSSLLPYLTMTGSDAMLTDEMQQVLLDPPTDLESEAQAMAVTAPNYVLEESLSSQRLWKYTAGNRPPQPFEERAFFEKMWAQNFARSQVEYQMPVEVLTAATPLSLSPFADGNFDTTVAKELSNYNLGSTDGGNHYIHGGASATAAKQSDAAEASLVSRLNDPTRGGHSVISGNTGQHQQGPHQIHEVVNRKIKGNNSDEDLTLLIKGDNAFGTTVSKSFARPSVNGGPIAGVDTVNISIVSYRVVESKKHGKYAQFLVIYREGSIRDTIGVWKRYSDFQRLSEKVTKAHEGCAAVIANISPLAVTEEHDAEHLPNAITSWRLMKKHQRWYRCLDAGYLSLKVFLLERFLQDILFESSTPNLLRDFVKGD